MKFILFTILSIFCFFRIQAQTPQIVSILFNSCTGVEGTDEYFIFQSNNDTVFVDEMSVGYPSGGTFCNSGCGSQTLGDDGATNYLTDLNNLAGCTPPLFIYSDTIPPGATVIVFTGLPPSYVMDFSSQCGNGQFYAVFSNNQNTTGRFSNSAIRYLSVNFGNGNTDNVTYEGQGGDGGTANFTNDGTASYTVSPDCIYPLSVTWGDFNVFPDEHDAHIKWETASEKNNDYFIVERRNPNGNGFEGITRMRAKGNGNSTISQFYELTDFNLASGIYYYRIKQVDFNGEFSYSEIRSLLIKDDEKIELFKIDHQQLYFNRYFENMSVRISDVSGRLLFETMISSKTNVINWNSNSNGIYLVHFIDEKGNSQVVKFGN
jgi:hypothetical protein